jgi:hypothetical protein
MVTNQKLISQAISNLKEINLAYWQQTLKQRLPVGGAGSIVLGVETAEELEQKLLSADWESYSHPAIMEGCEAFLARDIRGLLGVKALGEIAADTLVTLDDRKNTGKVSAVVQGVRGDEVDFTVLIVGKEEGRDVVFTFHPGEPVAPSKVSAEAGLHGKTVTVKEALAMGLTTVKLA